jgi:hypothetical protein
MKADATGPELTVGVRAITFARCSPGFDGGTLPSQSILIIPNLFRSVPNLWSESPSTH